MFVGKPLSAAKECLSSEKVDSRPRASEITTLCGLDT